MSWVLLVMIWVNSMTKVSIIRAVSLLVEGYIGVRDTMWTNENVIMTKGNYDPQRDFNTWLHNSKFLNASKLDALKTWPDQVDTFKYFIYIKIQNVRLEKMYVFKDMIWADQTWWYLHMWVLCLNMQQSHAWWDYKHDGDSLSIVWFMLFLITSVCLNLSLKRLWWGEF